MKILYVINNAAFFCSHRLPLAVGARAAGHDVALVTGRGASADQERQAVQTLAEQQLPHHVVAFTSTGTQPLRELVGVWQLFQHVRRERPDIVHCATPKGLLYGGLVARVCGVRGLVLAVSGMGSMASARGAPLLALLGRCYRAAVRLAYGHPNRRVIVQNRDDEAAVIGGQLARAKHVRRLPGSGVELPPYLALPLEGRQPLIVLPARMLRDKGVHEFVEAAQRLRGEWPDWRFALVGDVDPRNPNSVDAERLRRWAAAGDVEWWGHRTDMPPVFGAARIVCLPSFYGEGMPKALLEAAAAGCAVVTTDSVGCREAIEPGVTGDLVPPRDAVALADCLRALIADPARCRAYGEAGRRMACRRFDLADIVAQTLGVYDELAAPAQAGCSRTSKA